MNKSNNRLTINSTHSLNGTHIALKVNHFLDDVIKGLSATPKTIPPIYFYDKKGSELFEKICLLPEYYITRTEDQILKDNIQDIIDSFHDNIELIELGSGSSAKTKSLIKELIRKQKKLHYHPVDVSKEILIGSSEILLQEFENLFITAHVDDYMAGLERIGQTVKSRKVIIFLGSNLGNFNLQESLYFLKKISSCLHEGDSLLLGLDMVKDRNTLELAYNDAQGITSQFNLNLLTRMNRELQSNFDLNNFKHQAMYNSELNRIEMHLISKKNQSVMIKNGEKRFQFGEGESIHTESSQKFTIDKINDILDQAGLQSDRRWSDNSSYFELHSITKS